MFVYVNGKIAAKEEAHISAFDHGFLYGVGLFETFRIYDGHPFLLEDHINRLNEGLSELLIELVMTKEEAQEALTLVLNANNLQNAYIRMNVSAGNGEIGLQVRPYEKPNILIYTKPLPPISRNIQEKKAQLLTISRNTPEGKYRLKSHHFLNNIFAKREIGNSPDIEGIFLTAKGDLAEGVVSNLFWVKNKRLYTPSLETGILNGITRQFILKLANHNGLDIEEGLYKPEELEDAEEIFITNSIQEIVGINDWDRSSFPGKHGEITKFLHTEYQKYCHSLYSKNGLR